MARVGEKVWCQGNKENVQVVSSCAEAWPVAAVGRFLSQEGAGHQGRGHPRPNCCPGAVCAQVQAAAAKAFRSLVLNLFVMLRFINTRAKTLLGKWDTFSLGRLD